MVPQCKISGKMAENEIFRVYGEHKMQLTEKSAAVLLATLSEFTTNDLKKSELDQLFEQLKAYFCQKDKYEVIWVVSKTTIGLEVDFKKLSDILGENNE